jgi:hypothetical protein
VSHPSGKRVKPEKEKEHNMPVENAGSGATATKATTRKTAARKPTSRGTAAGQSAARAAGASDTGASALRSAESRRVAAGKNRIERTTELSEQVLEQISASQQSALEAVREFTESVDRALPLNGDGPSRRQIVIDSALSISQRLVKAQYDFAGEVVRGAGKVLSKPDNGE